METTDILIKPVVSEKSMNYAGIGKYTFVVVDWANKYQIKKAVEEQFKVDVVKVTTITIKGRTRKVGKRRLKAKLSDLKKAVVTLAEGQKIDIFEIKEG